MKKRKYKIAISSCIFSNRILCCAVRMVTESAAFSKNDSFLLENVYMFFLLSLSASCHHNYGQCQGLYKREYLFHFFSIMHWEERFLLTSPANNVIHVEILKSYWKNQGKNTHFTFHCFSFKNVIKERQHLQFVFCITWLVPQKVKTSNAIRKRAPDRLWACRLFIYIRTSMEISKNHHKHDPFAFKENMWQHLGPTLQSNE